MVRFVRVIHLFVALLATPALLAAINHAGAKKDKPSSGIVLLWPDEVHPTLKISFGKFSQLGAYNGQMSLGSDVLIENTSGKTISDASFTVYLKDKAGIRIGTGDLNVNDLGPGQQTKVAFQVMSVGIPSSLSLVARNDASGVPTSLKTVPLKVLSVPPGAAVKVDGKDQGITPTTIRLTVGNHILGFSKEGYASGTTPLDIKPDEGPGGSMTFELGGLSRDNVELRDGKVLQGDVLSVTMTQVVVRVDGKDETYDRNQVRKIILVERDTVQQPAVVQPVPSRPNQ
jgi:hypothetical protein